LDLADRDDERVGHVVVVGIVTRGRERVRHGRERAREVDSERLAARTVRADGRGGREDPLDPGSGSADIQAARRYRGAADEAARVAANQSTSRSRAAVAVHLASPGAIRAMILRMLKSLCALLSVLVAADAAGAPRPPAPRQARVGVVLSATGAGSIYGVSSRR